LTGKVESTPPVREKRGPVLALSLERRRSRSLESTRTRWRPSLGEG